MKGKIIQLTPREAENFLLPRHYSGRVPSISQAYGWVISDELKAVVTFGKPASRCLCKGICGEQYSDRVYELNRLCKTEDLNEPLSQFVSACLRRLRPNKWIIVSYSDTAMHHHGYIYQACNFIYTGVTKERTDIYNGGKHARHYTEEDKASPYRVLRSAKHRYVYFCTFNRKEKKEWKNHLKYPVLPYPKGDNQDYVLGEYLKPTIINKTTGEVVNIE